MSLAAFPDIHVEITDIAVENDRLVVRKVVTGTQNGELTGIAPTGKSATVDPVHFVRLDGGRVVERKSMTDIMSLFVQMSLVAPASA